MWTVSRVNEADISLEATESRLRRHIETKDCRFGPYTIIDKYGYAGPTFDNELYERDLKRLAHAYLDLKAKQQ